jgi:PEP-CTERM motif
LKIPDHRRKPVATVDGYSFNINLANYSQWHIDLAGGVFNNLGLTPAINYGVANTIFLDTYGGSNGGIYDLGRTQNSDLVTSTPFTIALAVPEPSTWAMLILGFAGIGFMAYASLVTSDRAGRAQAPSE